MSSPFACGGEATIENIALRCRAHNQYQARLDFGPFIVRESWTPWGEVGAGAPRAGEADSCSTHDDRTCIVKVNMRCAARASGSR
jgi:hypothetical protein